MNNRLGKHHEEDRDAFDGSIAAWRVYSWALTPDEIVEPVPTIDQPGIGTRYIPGMDLNFSGGADDFMGVPLDESSLTWQIEWHHDGESELVAEVVGVADSNVVLSEDVGFYRIILSAVDDANHVGDYRLDLYPAPDGTPAPWTAVYRFDNNARDDLGDLDGTLQNGAETVTVNRGADSYLTLDGSNDYVSLPDQTGQWRSFGAWIDWDGGNNYQRLIDTGVNTSSDAFVTTSHHQGQPVFEITIPDGGGTRDLEYSETLPTGEWVHVGLIMDGSQAMAVLQSINLLPADTEPTKAYLGRSMFASDPSTVTWTVW